MFEKAIPRDREKLAMAEGQAPNHRVISLFALVLLGLGLLVQMRRAPPLEMNSELLVAGGGGPRGLVRGVEGRARQGMR